MAKKENMLIQIHDMVGQSFPNYWPMGNATQKNISMYKLGMLHNYVIMDAEWISINNKHKTNTVSWKVQTFIVSMNFL